jgi:Ca2+-binding RTX toxin-like protein
MASEIRVNGDTENWQRNPDIEILPSGEFIVVWDSIFTNLDSYAIIQQRFDRDGFFIGNNQFVDQINGSASTEPRIAALRDGGYVVSFTYSAGGLLEPDQVWAQVYNADGSLRKPAFRVDALGGFEAENADVTALGNGGFLVAYGWNPEGGGPTGSFDDIYAQRYDANGNAIGGNFKLNTRKDQFDQNHPTAVTLKNGNVLVSWISEGTEPGPGDIDINAVRGTLLDNNGKVIKKDFYLTPSHGGAGTNPNDTMDVTPLANGGFAIAYYDTRGSGRDFSFDIRLQLFDSKGRETSKDIAVFSPEDGVTDRPAVTQLATGEILVVWEWPSPNGSNEFDNVYGRLFSSKGKALTGVTQLADFVLGDQTVPEVKALPDGGFALVWESEAIDGDDDGISLKVFGRGSDAAETVKIGLEGSYSGLAGDDTITGNKRKNMIDGGQGRDVIDGKGKSDRLTGGLDADSFIFSSKLSKKNVDLIVDFSIGEDRVFLESSIFKRIGEGTLGADQFTMSNKGTAKDKQDRIIYDKDSGALLYDSDGKGGKDAIKFAKISKNLDLTHLDFEIF